MSLVVIAITSIDNSLSRPNGTLRRSFVLFHHYAPRKKSKLPLGHVVYEQFPVPFEYAAVIPPTHTFPFRGRY